MKNPNPNIRKITPELRRMWAASSKAELSEALWRRYKERLARRARTQESEWTQFAEALYAREDPRD